MLVLDATADATILRRFLPDLPDLIEIEALWQNVEVIQVTDTVTAKSHLVPSAGASPEELQRRENRREDLRRLVRRRSRRPRRATPGRTASPWFSPSRIRARFRTRTAPPSSSRCRVLSSHGSMPCAVKTTGANVNTLIIAGRTQPNASAVEAMTAALFYADAEPIRSVGGDRYEREVRGYRMADKSHWGVETDLPSRSARRSRAVAGLRGGAGSGDRPGAAGTSETAGEEAEGAGANLDPAADHGQPADHHPRDGADRRGGAAGAGGGAGQAVGRPCGSVTLTCSKSADAARMAIGRLIPNKPLYEILIGECSYLAQATYRRPRPGKRATTGMLLYDPARADPALWLADHCPAPR